MTLQGCIYLRRPVTEVQTTQDHMNGPISYTALFIPAALTRAGLQQTARHCSLRMIHSVIGSRGAA
jgi:hypothetical protein